MASETSAVLVAVRVRPFNAKEDPLTCTIRIPDDKTITVVDTPSLLGETSSNTTDTNTSNRRDAEKEGPVVHHYTFDRILWSVPEKVLPIPPTALHKNDKKPLSSNPKVIQALQQYTSHFPCFNTSLPACESQEMVYRFIGPKLTDAVMNGFNACLFAYGQTGSGKSYSMIGTLDGKGAAGSSKLTPQASTMTSLSESSKVRPSHATKTLVLTEEMGIMPRLANSLFDLMQAEREKDESVSFTVEACFFEIYCEKVRDLLGNMNGGNTANTSSTSLRIRQHPSRGPYVENLSHIKVKSASQVVNCLLHGLKERATAETLMNEHSSRSHAIMQLHVTKVSIVTEDNGVMTKTRIAKVNMVDLAGSERVTQSGVTGERFEEAKNINLSLSTLGRVIQQLSEKQQGKNVIPSYRDSVLTWLLSDSLGGNSKTIMLATVAPSSYCYLQTLNTLRFAGVAKKVINVATVNEDQHFQKLIADLRQQIVRLTLQIESGKASEAYREEVRQLKEEKEELQSENDQLKLKVVKVVDDNTVTALRKRIEELEESNEALQREKFSLQQRLLSSTTQLREELADKRADLLKMQDQINTKDAALGEWVLKYKALDHQLQLKTAALVAAEAKTTTLGGTSGPSPPPVVAGARDGETAALRKKLSQLTTELGESKRSQQEAQDQLKTTLDQLEDYKTRYEESKLQLNRLQGRMENTLGLLETTQCQLAAAKSEAGIETERVSALQEGLMNAQLDQIRDDYLAEKQSNVQLLLKVSNLEQERSQMKSELANRQEDIFELEQLLMEETENSERYYLRLRYQRTLGDIQQHLTRRIAGSAMGKTETRPRNSSYSAQPSPISAFPSPRNDALNTSMSWVSHAPGDPLAQSMSQQHTWELMYAQLEYECLCDEAQSRSLIEQEYMVSTIRLLVKRGKLKATELQQLQERYTELQEKVSMSEEEAQYYRKKYKETDEQFAEIGERLAMVQSECEEREVEQLRLTRRVRALEESNEELERNKNSLVEKVAELLDSNEALKQRCTEAELLVNDAQNYFNQSSPTSKSAHSNEEEHPATATTTRPSEKIRNVIEQSALSIKEKELKAAQEEVERLTQQCEAYRTEIGELRAEANKENNTALDHREQLRRELEQFQKQKQALENSKAQLTQLMDSTVKDYEKRVMQQQDMINTLRKALDEETSMADACRASAQRAEAERLAVEEDMLSMKETNEELKRAQRDAEAKILRLQRELDDLRVQYNIFEKQLMELKVREPELYLVIERSTEENGSAWLDKARREKANMEKQKMEARRLNAELLEHVRRRNSHLREVQQQIQDVSLSLSPGVTPINDSLYDASALEEYNMLVSARNQHGQSLSPTVMTPSNRQSSHAGGHGGGDDLSLPSSIQTSTANSPTTVPK